MCPADLGSWLRNALRPLCLVKVKGSRAMADRTVSVKLRAEVDAYKEAILQAKTATESLDREVKGLDKDVKELTPDAVKASAATDLLGASASKAKTETRGLGDELGKTKTETTGLGNESDKTRTKIVDLAKDIEAAKAALKAMGEEFRKTGQIDMAKFNDASRTVRDLEKAKTEIEKLGSNAAQDGLNFGEMFSQGALKGIGRLYAEIPEVMVPLTALIAVGVGGAITSGVMAVVGGGAIAAGIASQFNNPVVHSAVTEFGSWLSADWHDATASFVAPLTAGLTHLQTDLGPAIAQMKQGFAALAPYVETFAMYLGIAAQRFAPGLADAMKASGPAIAAIARDLPILADGAASFFEQISKGSKGGVEGLDAMVRALSGYLTEFGYIIRFLSDGFDAIIQFEDKFFGTMAKIPGIGKVWQPLADYIHHVATSFDDTGQAIGATKKPVSDLKMATDLLNGALSKSVDLFDELFGKQMSVDEATLKYRQGLRDLTAEIDKNGRSLKEGDVVGDHNREAILQQIQAIEQLRTANIRAGMGSAEATDKYNQQLEALRQTLYGMHLNKAAVDALIDSYKSVPPAVTTHVSDPGAQEALDRVRALGISLAALPRETRIGIGIYETGSGTAYSYASPDRKFLEGGVTEYAQTGLLKDANVFSAGSAPLYGFAEPETGGEFFGPKYGNLPRTRAMADYAVTNWWGGRITWGGQQSGGSAPVTTSVVQNNSFTINSNGSPREIADEVSRVLGRQMNLRSRAG